MFPELSKKDRALSQEDCVKILSETEDGTLALIGDNGYPYSVPMSFAYADGKIYLHGLNKGYKMDLIRKNDKASFSVIGESVNVPEKTSVKFKSIIIFGRIRILSDEEKGAAIVLISKKYAGGYPELVEKTTKAFWNAFSAMEIEIEHMTGKWCNP